MVLRIENNTKQRTPVLIIPGFMSSGLKVNKSPHESWVGQRLWLNITQAGFASLHVGGKLRKNEAYRSKRKLNEEVDAVSEHRSSEEMHQEYVRQMECRSRWVRHMRLQSDMINEKEGIEVRNVPGTSGVDYLAPGALTESMSYVFGPVLKLLKSKGYKEGIDLDASPYDWRIPPSFLETRDNYFYNTMIKIEDLYRKSNKKPVLLLCHSMGCKTGHYLLNFVLHRLGKEEGQAWIDRHIHSYVPIGAPHCGAQKSIRGLIDGDKMGLDAFLDEDEGLALGRSFGSVAWMFPIESVDDGVVGDRATPQSRQELTLPQPMPIPSTILRNESAIRIFFPAQSLQLRSFVHNRKRLPPSKLRLAIQLGDDIILRTNFANVNKGGNHRSSLGVNFEDDSWLVACPPTIEEALRQFPYIQIYLEEPGGKKAPRQRNGGFLHLDILLVFRVAFCLFEWIFCCPCAALWKFGCCCFQVAKKGADIGVALLGGVRVIGQSEKIDWKKGVESSLKMCDGPERGSAGVYEMWARVQPTEINRYGFCLEKISKPELIKFKIKWEPRTYHGLPAPTMVCHQRRRQGVGSNAREKKRDISYSSVKATELIQMEGLTNAIDLVKETYEKDPIGPISYSSWQAPPVKKVTAIYGINLPTEVSGAYRRNPSVRISSSNKDNHLKQLFVLDKEATLDEVGSATHMIEDGVISETKKTPQHLIGGGTQRISGDGTVAYWSLQHCRAWRGKCDVTVHEIDKAEHREILNDKRFHKILLDILGIDW